MSSVTRCPLSSSHLQESVAVVDVATTPAVMPPKSSGAKIAKTAKLVDDDDDDHDAVASTVAMDSASVAQGSTAETLLVGDACVCECCGRRPSKEMIGCKLCSCLAPCCDPLPVVWGSLWLPFEKAMLLVLGGRLMGCHH